MVFLSVEQPQGAQGLANSAFLGRGCIHVSPLPTTSLHPDNCGTFFSLFDIGIAVNSSTVCWPKPPHLHHCDKMNRMPGRIILFRRWYSSSLEGERSLPCGGVSADVMYGLSRAHGLESSGQPKKFTPFRFTSTANNITTLFFAPGPSSATVRSGSTEHRPKYADL